MSSDDPALSFFQEIVEPTVQDFLAKPHDKRLGVLAALAVASMTEHYFQARPELHTGRDALRDFKYALRDPKQPGGNAALGEFAGVANATRHVLGRSGKIGFEGVNVLPMNLTGVMRADWPMGGEEVLVGDLPSPPWRLSDLLKAAMGTWRGKLGLPLD